MIGPPAGAKSREDAHKHACQTHGQGVHGDGTAFRLWGGEGDFMQDTSGTRKFDSFRAEIDRLGQKNGCHTCGRYKGDATPPNANSGQPMNHWVCDHQPPIGIIPDATVFQLYPQCHDCSNAQWQKSKTYVNSFKKHTGRSPDKNDQHLFWGEGRPHRPNADYARRYPK